MAAGKQVGATGEKLLRILLTVLALALLACQRDLEIF